MSQIVSEWLCLAAHLETSVGRKGASSLIAGIFHSFFLVVVNILFFPIFCTCCTSCFIRLLSSSLSLCFFLSPPSLSLSIYISPSFFLILFLFLSPSFFLILFLSLYLSLSFVFSHSLSLSISLSLSLSTSLSLFLFLSLSLSLSFSLSSLFLLLHL